MRERNINILTLVVREERRREVKWLAHGHSASLERDGIGTLNTCISGMSSGPAPAASELCNSSEDQHHLHFPVIKLQGALGERNRTCTKSNNGLQKVSVTVLFRQMGLGNCKTKMWNVHPKNYSFLSLWHGNMADVVFPCFRIFILERLFFLNSWGRTLVSQVQKPKSHPFPYVLRMFPFYKHFE